MEGDKKTLFLHGTLVATILDVVSSNPSSPSPLKCILLRKKPAYVTMKLGGTKVAETSHERDRVWNQTLRVLCAHPLDSTITVKLKSGLSTLCKAQLPAASLLTGGGREGAGSEEFSFPLQTRKGKSSKDARLRFTLHFTPAESETDWGRGVGREGFEGLIDGVTFPLRTNCRVVLYQDAHHRASFQPPLRRHGWVHQPRKLWEDVYKAIDGAKYFVYIAGWSLNPRLVLVRDPETEMQHARGVTLGELLKRKAKEGVLVRVMLWDDETSLPLIHNRGLMRTHDEDASQYFRHTKVVCKLCPRLHHDFPTLFTHHQKTITVDDAPHGHNDDDSDERAVMSFVGGVDLCDGRYDTEEHSLFRTLNTESHAGDFYQVNIAGATIRRGGPREPWHDAHACVTGAAAYDILTNFVQRWSKQCGDLSILVPTTDTFLPNIQISETGRSSTSSVQVFRSIDHASAKHTSPLPEGTSDVEHSIHDAYVAAIRRAERFVYIENQYFMGGCQTWDRDRHCGCENLIPTEIALKLASKIRAREKFAAYVVIPMWPEGVPESDAVQDMLHWTRLTLAMMYRLIGEALRDAGDCVSHPRDYLSFFCLVNREVKRPGELVPPESPHRLSGYHDSQRHRRFMIYVHSKLMIVDDEYLMIGSANINQRSMDGRRDTEIAVGCHQPEYVGSRSQHGDIHAYRMSLWYEHTGGVEEAFLKPESLDCVRALQGIGDVTWKAYSEEDVTDLNGVHLMNYPIKVSMDGSVGDLAGSDCFTDTSAPIKGKRSVFLPQACTT